MRMFANLVRQFINQSANKWRKLVKVAEIVSVELRLRLRLVFFDEDAIRHFQVISSLFTQRDGSEEFMNAINIFVLVFNLNRK